MLTHQLKLFITLLFSLIVIYFYYFIFDFHLESFHGVGYIYFLLIGVLYLVYKILVLQLEKEKLTFSFLHMVLLFLAHLVILCCMFFLFNGESFGFGLTLFFKIIWFSILPVSFFFISYSLGETILQKAITGYKKIPTGVSICVSTSFGFVLMVMFLALCAFFGFYNIWAVIIVFFGCLIISGKILYQSLKDLFSYEVTIESHQPESENIFKIIQPYLLTTEFLFWFITFLIGVNLINIVRPFPIGWDDLGVYMNYARITAYSGSIAEVGQMISWQIFTGIGYLFGSSTQAFFLNSFSGIITCLFLILSIGTFQKKSKIINIPLTIGAIYLALPMVIFHLAKDMKLDQGLFFLSIGVVTLILYLFSSSHHSKDKLKYLFVAGVISGFCFSVKLTSLFLISSIIGVLFFTQLGSIGFLAYICFYLAVFTKLGLWSLLNVIYPKGDLFFINVFSGFTFLIGCILIGLSIHRKKQVVEFFKYFFVYIIGVISILVPWFGYNYSTFDAGDDVSFLHIIAGKQNIYEPDFSKIHNETDDIKKIEGMTVSSEGTSGNEDIGRYFGYEKGVNNYIKLPWNLTMQVNQRGEFTDISFIFLALLPAILLFLPVKKWYYHFTIIGVLLFILLMHIVPVTSLLLTDIFSSFLLPTGYIIIGCIFLGAFLYGIRAFTFSSEEENKLFQMNVVFGVFYIFLWTISAFGIVWYGITMYYSLLILLAYGLYYCTESGEHKNSGSMEGWSGILIFFVIAFYFMMSSIPHGLNNLKDAGYASYKVGLVTEDEAVFQSRADYSMILYSLNIKEDKKEQFLEEYKAKVITELTRFGSSLEIQQIVTDFKGIQPLDKFMNDFYNSTKITDIQVKKAVKKVQREMYRQLLHPNKEYESDSIIYRVGTFLKYYVTQNNYRLYEDSLLFTFYNDFSVGGKYSPDDVIERMKTAGMKYLLVDLNAATIDEDPAKNLTKRYESLLKSLTSQKLEYVIGDSVCLKIALDDFMTSNKTEQDLEKFMRLAGVNYESIIDGRPVPRSEKMLNCFDYIYSLYQQQTPGEYEYLMPLFSKMKDDNISKIDDVRVFLSQYIGQGYKVLFKIL